MLAGNPGNGKTTIIKAMKTMIAYSGLQDPANLDHWGRPDKANLNIVKAYEIASKAKEESEFRKTMKKGLLAIDDFGTETLDVMSYGNVFSPITELLYERYDGRLFTVISTNLLNKAIRERYGERIADRFNEMMTCVTFPDISFRKLANK